MYNCKCEIEQNSKWNFVIFNYEINNSLGKKQLLLIFESVYKIMKHPKRYNLRSGSFEANKETSLD